MGVVTFLPEGSDFPWKCGSLEASEHFAGIRSLFDRAAELIEQEDFDTLETVLQEIMRPGIELKALENGKVEQLDGIIIAGNRVRWR